MRKQLLLLLTLGALLNYRPGHAQAHVVQSGDSPTLVAAAPTRVAAARATPDVTSTKTTGTVKKETTTTRKSQNSLNRIWSRLMGYCHEVHTASRKKS